MYKKILVPTDGSEAAEKEVEKKAPETETKAPEETHARESLERV